MSEPHFDYNMGRELNGDGIKEVGKFPKQIPP